MDKDKAIRAAKLTLGGMLEKRRAKSAVERAQGQIAPSKYLPGVPRQVHADGGNVDDPQPAAPPPADLGQAREQKQLRTFHSGLMGDIRSSVSAAQEAHQKALDAGVFDGYEVGDVLQGSAHPMRITGRYVQKWKPTKFSLQSFDRMGVKPTIIEHEGQQYIPMLRYQTGKEGVDGFQEGSAYLDGVKAAGYRKMGGLRAVKAEGGRIRANKGGKMGARADFLEGNHPEVPPVVYHATKADFHEFRPMSHFGTMQAAHDRYSPDQNLSEGMSVIPAHISLKNPLDVGRERDWQSNRDTIRQAADVMFKSGRLDQDYLKAAEKLYDLVDDPRWGSYHQAMERRGADLLREAGHDGIIYTNNIEDPGSRSFVTLGPEQVKSSIGNQGTFDPTHPDMTKKDGGSVTTQSKDGSGIFGEGAMIHRYVHPETGSHIEVLERRNGPASVLGLEVPEEHRGKGIGQMLQAEAMSRHPALMGQVSSKAAATTAYRLGRRPYSAPDASLDDVFSAIDRDSSVNMLTPQAQPKRDGGEVDGIDAFHSSPHDFDQFDIAHLGTGEGNQSYGHGLYFSANPKVSDRGGQYWNQFINKMKSGAERSAALTLKGQKWDQDAAVSQLLSSAKYHEDRGSGRYGEGSDVEEGNRLLAQEYRDAADHIASGKIAGPRTYRVKLNVKPHELLDWDAPLSEQHPNIQRIAREADISKAVGPTRGVLQAWREGRDVGVEATGKDLHKALSGYGEHNKDAADYLQSQGLKGIKYRDAGSRDLSDGDPTHNYVMFHHDPVKVVDKYEYGGVVGKSGGGSMGDDGKPVDLSAARAMRNFNQNSTGPTPEAEGVFNRLAAARDAAADAHEAAIKDGVFNSAQIGDVFKYKPLDTYAPMKVVDHGMVPVERWGGINPPKYVYKGHFPVAEVQYQDASKERRKFPIELLEDRDRYDFLSGKPRIARADGGRLNLYSKAARIIAGMKDRPMQAADIVKYALGKGAKKTELDHMDVPPGKATPKQVADHIEFMQPHIGVHRREGGDFRFNNSNDYLREMDRLHDNGMHDEAERLYEEFERFEGHGPADKPIYARFQLPGGQNYREHILTLDSHEGPTFMARDHWGKLKNPLAHIRMSDRIINGKKILHIEELQSDWNNHARKRGFSDGSEKRALDEFVQDMRQKAIAGIDPTASPMIRQALQQKYGAMDPHTLAQKLGGDHFDRLTDLKYKTMPEKMGAPRAPYINPDRDDASEVAMKHILMEAAKGGYDGIAFTPDEEQEKRWPGNTFKGIYNKKLPGMAKTLVQQHDPETDPDDMTHLQGWAVPMIPLSDKARDSIMQNGFSSFKRGGAVGYGDGGSVEPDIKNPMSIFPKPQRMFPEDQRPAGGQYLSMPNKADVTGHKAETATIGVAPGGKPFFRASQNAVDQTGSPGRGSATTKTNLFKQKAGWKWQEAPEGHENTDTIVSVEHRGRHFYALNAHFPKGVDLARYENATSEPRLRPTTQGNVELGPQAGSISVRGKVHPVYHHVIVKADGGAVDAALAATRRFTKDGQHVTMRLKD